MMFLQRLFWIRRPNDQISKAENSPTYGREDVATTAPVQAYLVKVLGCIESYDFVRKEEDPLIVP